MTRNNIVILCDKVFQLLTQKQEKREFLWTLNWQENVKMLIWECFQLDELRRNMEIERDCVNTTYAMLQETIQKQYEFLVKDLERWESFQARITRLWRPSNDKI